MGPALSVSSRKETKREHRRITRVAMGYAEGLLGSEITDTVLCPHRRGVNLELEIIQTPWERRRVTAASGQVHRLFRVSTDKQGKSGLGLEAQRSQFWTISTGDGGRWFRSLSRLRVATTAIGNSSRRRWRPARSTGRSLSLPSHQAFIAALMESGVEFVPHAWQHEEPAWSSAIDLDWGAALAGLFAHPSA